MDQALQLYKTYPPYLAVVGDSTRTEIILWTLTYIQIVL